MKPKSTETEEKKVMKAFRLDAEINAELLARSQVTGIDQTRIVEDALREHFRRGMRLQLTEAVRRFRPFESPLTPVSHICQDCHNGIVAVAGSSPAGSTIPSTESVNKLIAKGGVIPIIGPCNVAGVRKGREMLAGKGEISLSE